MPTPPQDIRPYLIGGLLAIVEPWEFANQVVPQGYGI